MALNVGILLFYYVLCQYIHSFVFPEMAGRGATAPLIHPLNPPLQRYNLIDTWIRSTGGAPCHITDIDGPPTISLPRPSAEAMDSPPRQCMAATLT